MAKSDSVHVPVGNRDRALTIPADWLSGVYLAKLTAEKEGAQSYIIFIVRDDRQCDFLFQVSDATWLAYNLWPGGYSLYNDGKNPRAYCGPGVSVSWDRPYAWNWHGHKAPLTLGSGEFFLWEYPLAYWMEKEGYDVSYISTLDTHTDRQGLRRSGRSFLSVGHDEYWSLAMFDNVRQAVDAGMNAAFFSGDTCWCVVPFLPRTPCGGKTSQRSHDKASLGHLAMRPKRPKRSPSAWPAIRAPSSCRRWPHRKDSSSAPATSIPTWGSPTGSAATPTHWLYDGTGNADGGFGFQG